MRFQKHVDLFRKTGFAFSAKDGAAAAFFRRLVYPGIVFLEEIIKVLENRADLRASPFLPLLLHGDASSGERPSDFLLHSFG